MKIREMRTKAETALGARFNIKDFHEVSRRVAYPNYF
jgi:uncharacterized protein (DUF885 family)